MKNILSQLKKIFSLENYKNIVKEFIVVSTVSFIVLGFICLLFFLLLGGRIGYTITFIISIVLVGFLSITLLSLWMTVRIIKPIQIVIKNTESISKRSFENIEKVNSNNEIGNLAMMINNTAKDLKNELDNIAAERNEAQVYSNILKLANDELDAALREKIIKAQELEKANKELQELDRMKSEFIAITSHELRTPLVSIKGYNELMLSGKFGPLTPKQKAGLEVSKRSIERLTNTVNDVLNIAQIDANKRLRIEPVSIKDFVNEVVDELILGVEQRHQTLLLNIPDNLPVINFDREKMIQVLRNLVLNSIRFTPDGGEITISVEFANLNAGEEFVKDQPPSPPGFKPQIIPTDNRCIMFSVKDTGIGIPKDELGRIFQRFYEVQSYKHHKSGTFEFKSGGSGLGLSIAKGIVEQHGGRIWVESVLDKGSTFYFTIPIGVPAPKT